MPGPLDLTGKKLRNTYHRVVQFQSGEFYDGLGNLISVGGSIVVNGENYLNGSTPGIITAAPVNLASSNVTGRLPFTNVVQITSKKLLGNPTNGNSNVEEIEIGAGLKFTGNVLDVANVSTTEEYNFTSLANFTIIHNLGKKVITKIILASGEEVYSNIVHNDINSFTVSFSEPQTGTVIYL